MRSKSVLLVSLCCLTCAFPALLSAQFQSPSKEELEMNSDPKAPGADAVYLYREEKTDDNLHYHSYYVRLKVLTEKGKELATVRTPYERRNFKVTDIQGRTIHSDGIVIPLTTKPSDLTDVKTKDFQVNTMVFTLPNVEVGSILEYRLQIRYEDNTVSSPTWQIQQAYFVHKAHYQFEPSRNLDSITDSRGNLANNLMYALILSDGTKMKHDVSGRFSLDVDDIPPIPKDDWMPPLNTINWRAEFYYSGYPTGAEFWRNEGKRWTKETDRFADPGKSLKNAVAELVDASDSDEQKARKIYTAVMKLDNTDFTREKSSAERKSEKLKAIRNAEDVWLQKSGTSDDLALLYVALARAAGLHVYPVQVVNRDRAIFDPNYLTLSQLDDYIVDVVLNGKDVYLDPGQKMCPFGLLHWKHSFASGLRLTDAGPVAATTPMGSYTTTAFERVADLNIDDAGNLKGTARFILTGQEALYCGNCRFETMRVKLKSSLTKLYARICPMASRLISIISLRFLITTRTWWPWWMSPETSAPRQASASFSPAFFLKRTRATPSLRRTSALRSSMSTTQSWRATRSHTICQPGLPLKPLPRSRISHGPLMPSSR
jgi:hypothetical protein